MSFSDVEHFAEIISGCESINSGNHTAPEARYAFAVLKLHAQDNPDFHAHAGQEGFLDSVKAGAKATGEFIKKLFEAIKKWFASTFKSTKSKLASMLKSGDEKRREAVRSQLRSIVIPKIEALKKAVASTPDEIKTDGFADIADKAIDSLAEGKTSAEVIAGMNGVLDAIDRVSGSFISYCNSHMPKKQADSHGPYDKAVKEYKAWGEKANALTTAITGIFSFKAQTN